MSPAISTNAKHQYTSEEHNRIQNLYNILLTKCVQKKKKKKQNVSRIQPEITSHVMIQENVIYTQKKWQSRATDLKMTQMLELVGKNAKEVSITLLIHRKENKKDL